MMDETTLLGKIVTFVMVGMLGWLAFTVQEMSVQQAVQGTQVVAIRESISVANLDRYTRSEAVADVSLLSGRLDRLEEWNSNLSSRLASLEQDIRNSNANSDKQE